VTFAHVLQAGVVLLAAGTPWIVARIAAARAIEAARASGVPAPVRAGLRRLTVATLVVSAPLVGLALRVAAPSLVLAVAALGAFGVLAVFGLAVLRAIDASKRSTRELSASDRVANLRPRRVRTYVSAPRRLVPYGITVVGLCTFVYQWFQPVDGRRLLMPVGFAIAAFVFLLLYEAWMREEVCGGQAEGGRDSADVERRILGIHRMQVALVTCLLLLANVLMGLDWAHHADAGVLAALGGGVLGVIGCAYALASDFTARRYEMTPPGDGR